MTVLFYFDTAATPVADATDAPVIAVKAFERGYHPVYTKATVAALNDGAPESVLQSALMASMFGWHTPAAAPAREYAVTAERAAGTAADLAALKVQA